jgi:hypothetical protein
MKKASVILFVLFLGLALNGFSQAAPPTDFFAGKWEISFTGTPQGDVRFVTNLVRKDGQLTGELANQSDPSKEKRPITKVEEKGDKITIFFPSSQGDEITIDLAKVDSDNLKGTLMDQFDAKAKRIKD